jgi:hypothetical protein
MDLLCLSFKINKVLHKVVGNFGTTHIKTMDT